MSVRRLKAVSDEESECAEFELAWAGCMVGFDDTRGKGYVFLKPLLWDENPRFCSLRPADQLTFIGVASYLAKIAHPDDDWTERDSWSGSEVIFAERIAHFMRLPQREVAYSIETLIEEGFIRRTRC